MSKGNSHKKEFSMDVFGRKYYCKHARLGLVRTEKKISKRKVRRKNKKTFIS